jgi:hypothetical protein
MQTTQINLCWKNILATYTQNTPKDRNFLKIVFASDKELSPFYPEADCCKFSRVHIARWKNLDICYSWHETVPQAYAQFYNKHVTELAKPMTEKYIKTKLRGF